MNQISKSDANKIITELEGRIDLGRERLLALPKPELEELIRDSMANYISGLSADRAGAKEVAGRYYQKSFGLLSTNIEALDNYAIGLVEDFKFAEAIPYFEQSVLVDSSGSLALVYLVKCYQETGRADLAEMTADYLRYYWPTKSPYLDWSHLGKPKTRPMLAPPFKEGQVWKYKTRDGDEDSRIWIRLADLYHGQPYVHISLTNLSITGNKSSFVSHLPFSVAGLEKSVIELTEEEQQFELADDHFGEGYGSWNAAHQQGKAGVFTAEVSEILEGVVKNLAG